MTSLDLTVEASTLKHLGALSAPGRSELKRSEIPDVLNLIKILVLADRVVYHGRSVPHAHSQTTYLLDNYEPDATTKQRLI